MVDTDGPALELLVHSADIQDRDGAMSLLRQFQQRHPFVERTCADSAYNSDRVRDATSIIIEIVRKFADQTGFLVHPGRWVFKSATTLLYPAAAIILIRRVARYA